MRVSHEKKFAPDGLKSGKRGKRVTAAGRRHGKNTPHMKYWNFGRDKRVTPRSKRGGRGGGLVQRLTKHEGLGREKGPRGGLKTQQEKPKGWKRGVWF